ncbi:Uncharacterised protein [[Clostridium] sordellii]|nr:hypothetical protein [Paeniclostridium sordellii]CEP90221.1 Uncharacterised protein [[Clostridium] sordellii] [Paeniclostridium sordellii]
MLKTKIHCKNDESVQQKDSQKIELPFSLTTIKPCKRVAPPPKKQPRKKD